MCDSFELKIDLAAFKDKLEPSLKFQRKRTAHERGGASAKSPKWPNSLFGQKLTFFGLVPAESLLGTLGLSRGSRSLIQLVLPRQNNFQSNLK